MSARNFTGREKGQSAGLGEIEYRQRAKPKLAVVRRGQRYVDL